MIGESIYMTVATKKFNIM